MRRTATLCNGPIYCQRVDTLRRFLVDALRDKEVAMRRFLTARLSAHLSAHLSAVAAVAVLGSVVAFAPAAAANSYAVSIGAPGFAVGFSNHGGYVSAYAPPPVYYAPAPVYYEPYSYGPTVVYGNYNYGPYYHPRYHRYYRHW
jgi:hypothetical protein